MGFELVNSSKNSVCESARIKDLDFTRFRTDDSFERFYLHVHHKTEDTIHRVYCKHCDHPMIEMEDNKLYWIFIPKRKIKK